MCNVCVIERVEREILRERLREDYIYSVYIYIQRERERERERLRERAVTVRERESGDCALLALSILLFPLFSAIPSVLTLILLFRLSTPFPSIMGIIEQDLFHISYIKTGKCLSNIIFFFSRMRMLSSWYLYVHNCAQIPLHALDSNLNIDSLT